MARPQINIKKEELINLYIENQLSLTEIKNLTGFSRSALHRALIRYSIPIRPKNWLKHNNEIKCCPKCKKEKSLKEFTKRKNRNGMVAYCKQCMVKRVSESYVRSREEFFKEENGICGICNNPISRNEIFHIDHIYPVSLGGTNHRENLQLSHAYCNLKKNNKIV